MDMAVWMEFVLDAMDHHVWKFDVISWFFQEISNGFMSVIMIAS